MSARAEPRFTRDVDLAVSVSGDADAERLVGAFQSCGYQILMVVEQQATRRLATVRLVAPGEEDVGAVVLLEAGICSPSWRCF